MQEAYRKDVERVFGVLQARFAIIKQPGRLFNHTSLTDVMDTCIIMHNMIVENERDDNRSYVFGEEGTKVDFDYDDDGFNVTPDDQIPRDEFAAFFDYHKRIRDKAAHYQLRNDLIDHLWNKAGNKENE
jgi:hypothetical protein